MSAETKSHLKHEVLVGGISNTIFNGLIAWLLLRGGSDLSWGGEHSFIGDIFATGLLLPFIVALIVIPLQRKKLRKGDLNIMSLGDGSFLQSLASRFPESTFKSAMLFGLIGIGVIAPLTLSGLYLSGAPTFSPLGYAVFKGIWAGALAGFLVIPMVLVALRGPANTATA